MDRSTLLGQFISLAIRDQRPFVCTQADKK